MSALRVPAATAVMAIAIGCGGSETTSTPRVTIDASPDTAHARIDAGSSDGGGPDGTPDTDGATDQCDPARALTVPEETWTYVEVAGSRCANGSTAGFGINRTSKSAKLVVFLKGGGACFQESDCSASDMDGFSEAKLFAQTAGNGIFDRASASNPFAGHSFVYIPYCTGDFHSGNRVSSYGKHHVGFENVTRYLERIVPTFCGTEAVVVTGTSAGGFGATFNYDQIHAAFGAIPVDLVDDSGPYMRPAYMPAAIQDLTADNWGWRDNVPASCTECASSWHALYGHASTRYPNDRISLVSSLRDPSIQGRFGKYGGLTTLDAFELGINDLADSVFAPLPNARVFYIAAQGHVWIDGAIGNVVVGGTSLAAFLAQQVDDDPAWSNVRP